LPLVRWTVYHAVAGGGLPVEEWAATMRARLTTDSGIEHIHITTTRDEHGIDGFEVADLSLTATVEAPDEDAAQALVKRVIAEALRDVVGHEPMGWMSSWHTSPADVPSPPRSPEQGRAPGLG
jgi:hypothetical protein